MVNHALEIRGDIGRSGSSSKPREGPGGGSSARLAPAALRELLEGEGGPPNTIKPVARCSLW